MFWESTLRALFFCSIAMTQPAVNEPTGQTISITAQRFSFSPDEITVKKGQEMTLLIESKDVSHGLLIEALGVRTEIKQGHSVEVKFTPHEAGDFEGKCAHFCGKGHGTMKLTVHVVE